MRVVAAITVVLALTGCVSASRPATTSVSSRTTITQRVDAYGSSANTTADVEAAKRALEASLSAGLAPDIKPAMLRRGARTWEEVPLDWFEGHPGKPHKVLALFAQSPEDRRRNPDWGHVFVLVQPTAGARWIVWSSDEGV